MGLSTAELAMQSDLFGPADPGTYGPDQDPSRPQKTLEQLQAEAAAYAKQHPPGDMFYEGDPNAYAQSVYDAAQRARLDPKTHSNTAGFALGSSVSKENELMGALERGWGNSQGRQGSQADPMLGLAARGDQQQALMYLQQAAAGKGPSAAQAMYQNNANAAMANAASMAAGARGGGPAAVAAQRAAMMGNAGQMATAANQGAALRAQEMQNAMSGYAGAAQGVRGQDAQWAMGQAQLQDVQRARDDARENAYMNATLNNYQNNSTRGFNNYWNQKNADSGQAAKQMDYAQRQDDRTYGMLGSALGGFGSMALLASDRHVKKDIKAGDRAVERTLSALAAKTYAYKDERHGAGPQVGIIAQDLERTPLGRSAVVPHPEGFRAVDVPRGLSISLAGLANLNKRLQAVEGKRRG